MFLTQSSRGAEGVGSRVELVERVEESWVGVEGLSISCLSVGLGEGVVVAEADAATGRVLRRGKLLDEVGHAALDLLDVALGGVHAALEFGNALDLVEAIQQHLAKNPCGPLPEARALE